MDYDQTGDAEEECISGVGDKTEIAEECRIADSLAGEAKCIFPFYFNGKKYDQCTMLEEDGFIIPVFSCPVHNITRKIDGINHFIYSDLSKQLSPGSGEDQHYITLSNMAHMTGLAGLCPAEGEDPSAEVVTLDPDRNDCLYNEKKSALRPCKNNCKGGGQA